MYSLGSYKDINEELYLKFQSYLDLLRRDKVKVIFFLPPYHPVVYKFLINSPDYRIINKVQKTFMNIASSREIEVIGSYNPHDCRFDEKDFYDGAHLKREAIEGLFKGIIK